jgi:cytochrome c oxidase assembly factor CtaG
MRPVPGWGSWSFEPVLWVLLIAATVWYVSLVRRARAAGHPVGIRYWGFFAAGELLAFLTLSSPLNTIAIHWLLWAHMAQHTLLADIIPPLVILGLRDPVITSGMSPGARAWLERHPGAGRFWNRATDPLVCVPVWSATVIGWALPPIFDFATAHHVLLELERLMLFGAGVPMWWMLISPVPSEKAPTGVSRLIYLAVSRGAGAVVGLTLTFTTSTLYPLYVSFPRGFGISALSDQELAGATMCLVESFVFGLAMAVVFVDALNREERDAQLRDEEYFAHSR